MPCPIATMAWTVHQEQLFIEQFLNLEKMMVDGQRHDCNIQFTMPDSLEESSRDHPNSFAGCVKPACRATDKK